MNDKTHVRTNLYLNIEGLKKFKKFTRMNGTNMSTVIDKFIAEYNALYDHECLTPAVEAQIEEECSNVLMPCLEDKDETRKFKRKGKVRQKGSKIKSDEVLKDAPDLFDLFDKDNENE